MIAVVAGVTVRLLVFNTDTVTYFPQKDPFIQDMYALTSRIGGFDEIAVSYDAPGGKKGYFLDPGVLRQAAAVEKAIRSDPDVCYSVSMPSLLSDINRALTGREEVPANRAVVQVFSRLVGSAGAGRLVIAAGQHGQRGRRAAHPELSDLQQRNRPLHGREQVPQLPRFAEGDRGCQPGRSRRTP